MGIKKKYVLVLIMFIIIITTGYIFFKLQQPVFRNRKDVIVIKDNSKVEPGLGLTNLHEKGYTGQGVNVAIIDKEFSDRLVHYERVGLVKASRHGTAVTSILVGEKCGVIPEANLHYFAVNGANENNVLRAIERVIEYNKTLDKSKKIRFVNISNALDKNELEFNNLIYKARENGMIIFSSTMPTVTDPPFALRSANYESKEDMNNLNKIIIGDWMNRYLSENNLTKEDLVQDRKKSDNVNGYITLYIPSVGRYVASLEGQNEYIYDPDGGLSWATPVLTGLAAMTLQVNPNLTNEEILSLLRKSIITNENGLDVINPELLIKLAIKTKE